MKTTIILILTLLCQFANGQLNETFETYLDTANFSVYDIPEVEGLTFIHKEYVDAKITKFILSNWDEYSKECYADSTLEYYEFYDNGVFWFKTETIHPDDKNSKYKVETVYSHKNPDFPGFMKWLQNKVK